jgi:hypothetical protein
MARETSAQRAASLVQVSEAVANDPPEVKKTAFQALIPQPRPAAADLAWVILVVGLVGVLVLTILGLTHVIGKHVTDDTIITVFSSTLAGLLGLFVKSPVSGG